MSNKELLLKLIIILLIFSVGFFLRMEAIHLNGAPVNEKDIYQGPNGIPYMYELDSYYNYRLTQNYLDHGYLGDKKINGTEWDSYSYYPGVPMDYPPLIIYLTAFIYKLVNIFTQIPLLTVCYWLPVLIGPLCGIPAYFFVSRLTNEYGGIAAGLLAVSIPFYAIRSFPGWFDTDMFNIIFPILIVWFFIESYQAKNTKSMIFFASLSAFTMFLFAAAWNGYQYLFYLMIAFCIFYIIWTKFKGRELKNIVILSSIFTFSILLLIYTFLGPLTIIKLILSPLSLIKLFSSQNIWYPWPDTYVFISELRKPDYYDVLYGLDLIIMGLGILGIFLLAGVLTKKNLPEGILNRADWFFFSFLATWILIGFLASIKGVRFFILLLPPLLISAGIAVGISNGYLNSRIRKNYAKILSVSIILVVFISPAFGTYAILNELVPGADDDMWNSAEWINKNTAKNTVIITEWSYGHFYSAIADRSVLQDGRVAYIENIPIRKYENNPFSFNGKSPNTSRDYWISRALSTSNENLSAGILNMIATTGDAGPINLDKYTKNSTKTIEILNNILGVNRDLAREMLIDYGLKPSEADDVLAYTHHYKPNPIVFVTFNDIHRKYWIYYGEWNFTTMKPGNCTYSNGTIHINDNILNSTNQVKMDSNTITWHNKTPYCYMKITNGQIEKHYLDKNSDFCIILLMDDKKAVVMDKKFENSIFTKLVIERKDTIKFKSIYENKKINVWKVI
ncbi:MAG: STT3 domain-containing protein [Methanobacterium sp.]|nr:STT3 domain-containing protein [Methanobacterium sp.]